MRRSTFDPLSRAPPAIPRIVAFLHTGMHRDSRIYIARCVPRGKDCSDVPALGLTALTAIDLVAAVSRPAGMRQRSREAFPLLRLGWRHNERTGVRELTSGT